MSRFTSVLLLIGLVALAAPTATARSDILPYTITHDVSDSDGDGLPEPSAGLSGGYPCGCMCPTYTNTLHVEAAGQELFVSHTSGGCYENDHVEADPGEVDPDGPIGVDPQSSCSGYNCPVVA